jgi:hypothetical protein
MNDPLCLGGNFSETNSNEFPALYVAGSSRNLEDYFEDEGFRVFSTSSNSVRDLDIIDTLNEAITKNIPEDLPQGNLLIIQIPKGHVLTESQLQKITVFFSALLD